MLIEYSLLAENKGVVRLQFAVCLQFGVPTLCFYLELDLFVDWEFCLKKGKEQGFSPLLFFLHFLCNQNYWFTVFKQKQVNSGWL